VTLIRTLRKDGWSLATNLRKYITQQKVFVQPFSNKSIEAFLDQTLTYLLIPFRMLHEKVRGV